MYGLVKTLKTDDGKEIKLVGNALTFIFIKAIWRDLLRILWHLQKPMPM